ncbi:MAG: DUF5103 domain-containing protein [Bacteroidota bacterium]|jgi:hypothetical protein|nr:DUF5103 domain-containing protein [Bacteroidota bacterium]
MKSIRLIISAFVFFVFFNNNLSAQTPDSIYTNNITTVRLYNSGNQLTLPLINLNSNDQVELDFDDLDADVKYYYYTYQLCNSDWTPANLGQFDYIKGFTQLRINTYRFSSIALTRYTHYQALLPDKSCYPTRSGNYLLKVYLNGDTSQLAFTKRLMVLDNKAAIVANVVQPFSPALSRTHQKIRFNIDVKGVNSFNAAQQIKVVVLQNYRWDNAIKNLAPAFIRGSSLEYNSENSGIFPAGKEWRWLDLRDFHLQSDRVLTADYNKKSTDIFLRPDGPLSGLRYVYYHDNNGMSIIEAIRGINPFWEGDYATVYFSFVPPNGIAYTDKNIYLFGQLTNYNLTDSLKMTFNPEKGKYETHLFMKQGYYDYTYLAVDKNNPAIRNELDGNYYETENLYTILVYYKSFIGRADELIGVATFDSRTDQPGLSF